MICNIEHDFKKLETLREDHKHNEEFGNVTPIREVPVITEGSYKIISGPCQFMFYLCNTRALIKDRLYPKDCERMINRHLTWYQNKLRPKTQMLIRVLGRQLQHENGLIGTNEGGLSRSSTIKNPSQIEFELEPIKLLLEYLDGQLRESNTKYFGNQLSICDLLYYWEISMLQHLLKKEIVQPNTELATWFNESMKKSEEIRLLEQKALEAFAKYRGTSGSNPATAQ